MTRVEIITDKTYLVPTDFSEEGRFAVEYAAGFAAYTGARLVLFHSIKVPIVTPSESVDYSFLSVLETQSSNQLKNISAEIREKHPALDIKIESRSGFAVEEILGMAKSYQADLIIMGTHGAGGIKKLLIGSNTADVITKSTVPVLAIPMNVKFQPLQQVVFATNYQDNDFKTLFLLAQLFKSFKPEIKIVHIEEGGDHKFEQATFDWYQEQVSTNIPYDNFSFHLLKSRKVEDGLDEFISHSQVDLLALSMRKRNYFQKLFGKSLTKRYAFHSKIPMLAFHAYDE